MKHPLFFMVGAPILLVLIEGFSLDTFTTRSEALRPFVGYFLPAFILGFVLFWNAARRNRLCYDRSACEQSRAACEEAYRALRAWLDTHVLDRDNAPECLDMVKALRGEVAKHRREFRNDPKLGGYADYIRRTEAMITCLMKP